MLSESDIQGVVDRIVRACGPERIVLFGSRAWGAPRPDSDVDLLVIGAFEGTSYRQAARIYHAAQAPFAMHVIVLRPQEAQTRYAEGDTLVRAAIDDGQVLYHRSVAA